MVQDGCNYREYDSNNQLTLGQARAAQLVQNNNGREGEERSAEGRAAAEIEEDSSQGHEVEELVDAADHNPGREDHEDEIRLQTEDAEEGQDRSLGDGRHEQQWQADEVA